MRWLRIFAVKAEIWGIPSTEVSLLTQYASSAETALSIAESSERTAEINAQCKAAFEKLTNKMRFIKRRYLLSPPLTAADLIALGLKPQDNNKTPVPPPAAQAEADITRPGVHLLELHLRPTADSEPDPHRSEHGFRIYYGIMPPGGASMEAATGTKRELMKVPLSGKELPFSKFTRRKRDRLDFPQEDSGKTAYFCICYENSKGDSGPWGPVFSSIIP
jgi:hypothetical protein